MNNLRVLAVLLFGVSTVYAQYDEEAKKVLQKLSNRYENMSAFNAEFVQKIEMDGTTPEEVMKGEITVSGDDFRLQMDDIEIVKNDNTVWRYTANEVNISNYEPMEGEININNIFGLYEEGFKYMLVGEEQQDGNTIQVIDLIPEESNQMYYRIRMKIVKSKNELAGFVVYDRSNTQFIYDIVKFEPNLTIPGDYFIFKKENYPGVRVEDLRY